MPEHISSTLFTNLLFSKQVLYSLLEEMKQILSLTRHFFFFIRIIHTYMYDGLFQQTGYKKAIILRHAITIKGVTAYFFVSLKIYAKYYLLSSVELK